MADLSKEASTTQERQPTTIFTLPLEIREEIWYQAILVCGCGNWREPRFIARGTHHPDLPRNWSAGLLLSRLNISRQICSEVMHVACSRFDLCCIDYIHADVDALDRFLQSIPSTACAKLRKLYLSVEAWPLRGHDTGEVAQAGRIGSLLSGLREIHIKVVREVGPRPTTRNEEVDIMLDILRPFRDVPQIEMSRGGQTRKDVYHLVRDAIRSGKWQRQ